MTLLFDAMSFPFMLREIGGKRAGVPTDTLALKRQYDTLVEAEGEVEVRGAGTGIETGKGNGEGKGIDYSKVKDIYVNVKPYCKPWPSCILTH